MFRSNNYKIMSNYLLSIPDVISVYEAADTVGTWFAYVEKSFYKFAVKNKPKYILENYICFHKDLKYGVYQDEGRFYFVSIMKPKYFLGFQWYMFTIQVVSEILTDSPNWSSLYKNMPVKRIVKSATPKGDLSWYVKWTASMFILLAVMMRAQDGETFQTADRILSLIGCLGWTWVGLMWKDRALIILNAIIVFALGSALLGQFFRYFF